MARAVHEIAAEIRSVWPKIHPTAAPYLDAMDALESPSDMYFSDNGRSIIAYFVGNARTWTGPEARRIKAELREMIA